MKNKKGFTLWLTGLSGAGKTTLAILLTTELRARGVRIEVLDGDEVRTNLSKGLGFSKEDRDTNIRRIGYVCRLLSRNGVGAVSAAISPYSAVRDEVRHAVEQDGAKFIEVFVKCPIAVLAERDVKGLYQKALAGELQGFTGVSDPYEEPIAPDVIVETDREPVEFSLSKILQALEQRGLIPNVEQSRPRRVRSVFPSVGEGLRRNVSVAWRGRSRILNRLFLKRPFQKQVRTRA
jgi:adenylyl-sulfate kinase